LFAQRFDALEYVIAQLRIDSDSGLVANQDSGFVHQGSVTELCIHNLFD
jgi:hypothetical protein